MYTAVAYVATNVGVAVFAVWLEPLRLAFKALTRREALLCGVLWLAAGAVFWWLA